MGISVAKRAIGIFLPLAGLAAIVLYLLYQTQERAILRDIHGEESRAVDVGRQRIEATFGTVVADMGYLSEQPMLRRWLGSGSAEAKADLAADYLEFAIHQAVYDQVRLVDLNGRELIRVRQAAGRYAIASGDELRNGIDGFYVSEVAKLGRGHIYVSPFDLSVENHTVRQPIRPTIRFGAPLFDDRGQARAVLMLDYQGRRILDRIKLIDGQTFGDIWLLNAEGYWLRGPTPSDEWTFMYPNRQQHSFKQLFPDAWEKIHSGNGRGEFVAGGSLFSYGRIDVVRGDAPAGRVDLGRIFVASPMFLVAHASENALLSETYLLRRNIWLAGASLAVLFAIVAWASARHWTIRDLSEDAVRRSESRFRGLMEAAPDAVVVMDADGKIIFANAQTETLFGYEPKRLIGCSVEVLIPARHRARVARYRSGYVTARSSKPMEERIDIHCLRLDGSEFPAAVSLSAVGTEQGPMIYADIRDVTEREEAQRKIEALNQQLSKDNLDLQALNREMEAFSYSVSHDLRAPLRAIDGFSQAIAEDCAEQLDALGRSYLVRIRGAAQRMGLLIDDLLKLSRVTRSELHVADIDLSALANDVIRDIREADPARDIDVVIAPGLSVSADLQLMRIVLDNLLSNAWKFTSKTPKARIEFGHVPGETMPTYFVRDNGAGFDMAYSNKLFGAFQRLHDVTAFPGTGIGLATVQRIVHKHGGRVWAESQVDKGATFYFTLQPRAEGEEDDQ